MCVKDTFKHLLLEKKKKTETAVWADQSLYNSLDFLGFSCCLLFCVGGSPIVGLLKSQCKCFQMIMSCRKKKAQNLEKGFLTAWLKKKEKKKSLMLISCRHEQTTVGYVLRQHYTLHLCTTLGFFVKEKRLTSPTVNNCSTISGNKSESNV